MITELGIGTRTQSVEIPDQNLQEILLPNQVEIGLRGEAEVRRALEEPIGTPLLRSMAKPGQKIVIITSDVTRPCPSYIMLPPLLEELEAAGVKDVDITIVIALGSHRKQTEEEKKKLVGEAVYDRIAVVDSNAEGYVHMGETAIGTPIDISTPVAEADFKICLGNIEYHYFAGYSGGAKAIMPGVSTRAAIQSNHSMMVRDEACAGRIAGNPIREDIEAAAAIVGVNFILNVVLDEHKKIVKAVAGEVTKAHREGVKFLDSLYQKKIAKEADIVIASQGGAPKDLNLYQTQKALNNAKAAVRQGGVIILVGSCKEGLGEGCFEEWMLKAEEPEDLIRWIRQEFKLGGHKAAAIALTMQKADIYLVSDMEPDFVRSIFMTPFATVQDAFDAAMEKMGIEASVIVMPYGGSTLPVTETA
ncbi:MAG: nickel-dependent lactate racemase [Lachnospiraceae bacterium]|nr:nickel-dependent lactate racemase [Lachnospiraceae bacterium]